ncbi:MAG TPA: cation:dicarboxylase symporter family transporter, partial [Allosphingosinicella sp.]
MAKRLTYWILIGLVLGIVVGWGLNFTLGDGTPEGGPVVKEVARYLSILTTIFLHMIKMIIAPLVFSTLVVGIAHMGDTAALGRVGMKALGWFVAASLVSLTLGLILVTLFQPGTGLELTLPPATASAGVDRSAFDIVKFFGNIFPESMIRAMSENSILQIVVFSL